MANLYYNPIQSFTIKSDATIGANLFVDYDGTLPAAGSKPFGVTQYESVAGDDLAVDTYGIVKVQVGAAVTAGADLEVAADGQVITLNTGKSVGIALTGATTAGDLINIKLG